MLQPANCSKHCCSSARTCPGELISDHCTVEEDMTVDSSIAVPCCRQRFTCHFASVVLSLLDCPFCEKSIAKFAGSSSFLASSLFLCCLVDFDVPLSNRGDEFLGESSWFPSNSRRFNLFLQRENIKLMVEKAVTSAATASGDSEVSPSHPIAARPSSKDKSKRVCGKTALHRCCQTSAPCLLKMRGKLTGSCQLDDERPSVL